MRLPSHLMTRKPQTQAYNLSLRFIPKLEAIESGRLNILDVDILNGTPLLDIKPFVPSFDVRSDVRSGWFSGKEGASSKLAPMTGLR